MPSCVATEGPHDCEAVVSVLIAALMEAVIAAAPDRCPYSRAVGICGRSYYL